MQKGQKIKTATRRIESANRRPARKSFWLRVWHVICWPFKMLWRGIRGLWNWICGLELIGLINSALLIAIIVMCSMLIIDIVQSRQTRVVLMPVQMENTTRRTVIPRKKTPTLPLKQDENGNLVSQPIHVVPVTDKPTFQAAIHNDTMFGDIIIENRNDAALLHTGTRIKGNLYLQHMRKYILPCGVQIDGNLFLRDLGMLEFCGEFTVTGNIYVTPSSSFGPIPGNARVGGQVIL